MKRLLNIIAITILFIVGLFSLSFAQETLTITTYYPSPYGSYKELRADQMAIGSAYRTSTLADGNLLVSGNVGIGTASPGAKLDIAGNIKIADGTQGAGKVLTSDATGVGKWSTPPAPTVTFTALYINDTETPYTAYLGVYTFCALSRIDSRDWRVGTCTLGMTSGQWSLRYTKVSCQAVCLNY